MSEETKREKGKQVSATVSPGLYEALDEYGWQNRKKRTDLVRQAVEEFADRNNIWPVQFEPATLDSTDQDNEVHHEA